MGVRFEELRNVFASTVNRRDWIFEKSYPLAAVRSGIAASVIPNDVEDVLLLLRLYQPGDISFIRLAIVDPSGSRLVQAPYRAINDLNSYAPLEYQISQPRCKGWPSFAASIRGSQSWGSLWFATARRFFLTGGAKPFKPEDDDLDRIVDYTVALESTLVPENGFSRGRISHRAAALIAPSDPESAEIINGFFQKIYAIRSVIAHGGRLSAERLYWLSEHRDDIELRVRKVLATAVEKLPPGDAERRAALAALFDPVETDRQRADSVVRTFRQIRAPEVRKSVADKLASIARR